MDIFQLQFLTIFAVTTLPRFKERAARSATKATQTTATAVPRLARWSLATRVPEAPGQRSIRVLTLMVAQETFVIVLATPALLARMLLHLELVIPVSVRRIIIPLALRIRNANPTVVLATPVPAEVTVRPHAWTTSILRLATPAAARRATRARRLAQTLMSAVMLLARRELVATSPRQARDIPAHAVLVIPW